MTDNEIIKGLECHLIPEGGCEECPFDDVYGEVICSERMAESALDLISRQKAEIERLETEIDQFANVGKMHNEIVAESKTEAVKEFAERFENEFDKIEHFYFEEEHENFVSANKVLAFLDNLTKEMVGEG